jgi:hypothetical protein
MKSSWYEVCSVKNFGSVFADRKVCGFYLLEIQTFFTFHVAVKMWADKEKINSVYLNVKQTSQQEGQLQNRNVYNRSEYL